MDDHVAANKTAYSKCAMTKAVRHNLFDGKVIQIAPGNVNTLFLCVGEDQRTFLVACGIAVLPKEGAPEDVVDKSQLVVSDI